jgi:PleD family two-component response regulator
MAEGARVDRPRILLASADRLLVDTLQSVLQHAGYSVLTAGDVARVHALAARQHSDGIVLDLALGDGEGFGLCRVLRASPTVSRATPIILRTTGPVLRAQQLDALRCGAWELRGDPLDIEELVLRLDVYIEAKLETDRLGTAGLVDEATGLYNEAGMARRSEELAALTARQGLPLACAVFRPADEPETTAVGDRLAPAFRDAGRISDAVGRTGPAEFTVFAPGTDSTAVRGLVSRISGAVARTAAIPLRAGASASSSSTREAPAALLGRARAALA